MLTLLSADLTGDPYPLYRAIREQGHVYFDPGMKRWLITGYAEAMSASADLRFSSRQSFLLMPGVREMVPEGSPLNQHLSCSMILNDPPAHTRLRGLVSKSFTPKVVATMQQRIQDVTEELLNAVQGRGEMDLISDFAYPLPLRVIGDVLGFERAMLPTLKKCSDDIIRIFGTANPTIDIIRAAENSVHARNQYILKLIEMKQAEPQDDLLSEMVAVRDSGEGLTDDEICATCGLLLSAGHETTTGLVTTAVLELQRNREQLSRLREEPELIELALEEFLRYESSAQWNGRIVREDVELGGVTLR